MNRSYDDPKRIYISVKQKFWISHVAAGLWMLFSIGVSMPWLQDFARFVTLPAAILIIAGISYIPGYMNAFMIVSLLLDRQPPLPEGSPEWPVTVLIACHNEERGIRTTLAYLAEQEYAGPMKVIVIDNNSSDLTTERAKAAGRELGLDLLVIEEKTPGKNHALNTALNLVETDLMITLDADTLLHKLAVKHIVSRMESAPPDICAVAGAVLVRNSRHNFWAKLQEWDYFLGIASIKRLQGMFQGTLVAQGAFSLYKTDAVRAVEGWPDAIGEDIVLTWKFLARRWRVYFEPLAVAFTDVPESFRHLVRQRSRWARGMIEALKMLKPWNQPSIYAKYLTGCNLLMPYLDLVYTFCWLPGLVLAFFGIFWIVGPATLLVLPLTFIQNFILYRYQSQVFRSLNLRIRKNLFGFIAYVLLYQMVMSPVSVYGYVQEALQRKRIWK
ncbi:glycosyltransferase [Paenibacillus sp. MBLB2552]|uniref:Glycosyltransferase n=1 Tax=Paenibacillus mellifer TaxID=2937794 RepID=A0A9X1XUH6_9BACL|nr:glycosyltransferase [Paenibacillus mellifer]MCK8485805.1 glycosyltransferase [Paenibacillus mellifer]